MTSAYMGKILRVDLSTRKISVEVTEEDVIKKYVGGSGLGAKYYLTRLPRTLILLVPETYSLEKLFFLRETVPERITS